MTNQKTKQPTNRNRNQRRIAIIGGGPGGLTLALVLQRHGIESVIYEREPVESNRDRGGSLDIHEDSGQLALKEAGLLEAFQAIARYEGEDFLLVDKLGTTYRKEVAEEEKTGDRPEIDRGTLCELLLNDLEPSRIRYGYKLVEALPLEDGRHELRFENGHVDTVDLVIGADGAFSLIRPLLTESSIEYSGLSMVELNVEDAARSHPDLYSYNGRGKMFALSDNKAILAQLNGDGRIKVYLSFRADRDWLDTNGIPFDRLEEAKRMLMSYFDDWNDTLKNYIRYAGDRIVPRRIYMLPVGFTWSSRKGITLIGDAAHLMSPFAGEGVNLAMLDASELALSLARHENLEEAVRVYEEKMYAYSSQSAKDSNDNLKLIFGDNAAEKLNDLFNHLHAEVHS